MDKENFGTQRSLHLIEERINQSSLDETSRKRLIKDLHGIKKQEFKDIEQLLSPLKNRDGKILRVKHNLENQRKATKSFIEKNPEVLERFNKRIQEVHKNRKNKPVIIQKEIEKDHPDISQFTLSEETDYGAKNLNQNNYSDFLNGKLTTHIRPKITLIVAYDNNYGIGKDGHLPWHIPEDLKWFKNKTSGKPVVMGRTNYEDISRIMGGKGLPNRKNIVLSSQIKDKEGFEFHSSVQEILNTYRDEKEIFIIGGTMLYETFLPIADEIIATEINKEFDTDVKFPSFKDNFICWENIQQQGTLKNKDSSEEIQLNFKRYVRTEPPKAYGTVTIKGQKSEYDYSSTGYYDYYFLPDTIFFMGQIGADFMFAIAEHIVASPLPMQTLFNIMHYGESFTSLDNSVFSFFPDLFAQSMSDTSASLLDYFTSSHIDFSDLSFDFDFDVADIGDIFGNIGEGIGDVLSAIFEIFN